MSTSQSRLTMLVLFLLLIALASAYANLDCHIQGRIVGVLTREENKVDSYNKCLQICNDNGDICDWFTFDGDDRKCFMYQGSVSIDKGFPSSYSGQRECDRQDSPLTKLLVVGGAGAPNTVELLDLSSPIPAACPPISNFLGAPWGSVGTYLGGGNTVMVCGGAVTNKCFYYDPSIDEWVQTYLMAEARMNAAAVRLSESEWWITGGYDGEDGGDNLETTEVLTASEGFSYYTSLPGPKDFHNMIQINETHFMVVGDNTASTKAFVFNTIDREWSQLENLQRARVAAQAGLVTYSNGTQVVVVTGGCCHGERSTEIFDLINQRWHQGPELPHGIYGGASVQYENGFLVVGGSADAGTFLDSIYFYDPSVDDWVLMSQSLERGRRDFAAFQVPEDFAQCQ